MIEFRNFSEEEPYNFFKEYYDLALESEQQSIEAVNISSYDLANKEVNSRYVNLKYIDNKRFIFFSNYGSPKSKQFEKHKQIAATIFWDKINVQIRIKADIKKLSRNNSKKFFKSRSDQKNALAISSNQSSEIKSYEEVVLQYNETLKNSNLRICPEYWGGFCFTPYYFEFWEGHKNRINKRKAYTRLNDKWDSFILQP